MNAVVLRIVVAMCAGLFWVNARAALPPVAVMDRSVWPEQLVSEQLFDVASRAEILAFAHALYVSEGLDEDGLKARLGLRSVNMQSINLVRNRLWTRLLENYQFAQKSCEQDASFCVLADDMDQLRERAVEYQIADDSFYASWAKPSEAFHTRYLNELLRMAALFPQTSSEIERYNSDELSGDEMPDRTFMLNFDSGPTAVDGGSDWVTDFLRQQKLSATFNVLGKSLQERLEDSSADKLQALYRLQCVGIQGWEYRSHSQWVDWQSSVQRSAALVQQVLPDNYVPLFRPPYGHRRADSAEFFRAQDLRVSLWNIDSQDLNARVTPQQSAERVLTLMLLWRRGTIVFHDTNTKAQDALPWLLLNTSQSGVQWQDCHQIPDRPVE